jgi:ATP-binding cassette subfamily B (MDR/TAP) protein 1
MFSVGMATPNLKAVAEGKVAGKMAFEVIDRVPKINQDEKGTEILDKLEGDIEFKNVTFYYPSRPDNRILDNFSAKFQKGKTTAIVGPSGSGKSTLVQLIERFYDPEQGQVLIDGRDIKTINLRDFRRKVGYVGQEPVLFNQTIKENILLGYPDATDVEVENSLKNANAFKFVAKHKEGINLHVGAAGSQISGGQK